jgi:CRP-like cAMP-binding protein
VGDKMAILDRGQVEVFAETPAGERQVAILHEGDYFGEMSLLLDTPRLATGRAMGAVQLLTLSKADLDAIMAHWPEVREQMLPLTEQRLAALQAGAPAPGPDGAARGAPVA